MSRVLCRLCRAILGITFNYSPPSSFWGSDCFLLNFFLAIRSVFKRHHTTLPNSRSFWIFRLIIQRCGWSSSVRSPSNLRTDFGLKTFESWKYSFTFFTLLISHCQRIARACNWLLCCEVTLLAQCFCRNNCCTRELRLVAAKSRSPNPWLPLSLSFELKNLLIRVHLFNFLIRFSLSLFVY